ncbi:unnamed protein product [Caenorhabditis angaria]|uniref:Serpentine receptor class gamma n=1 Tax=Caenorhabditis angaria TaxID=860376 RepID=A0A9P1MW48_9PELO|nr:unnamed protein product [Caenorhabditis angaria]
MSGLYFNRSYFTPEILEQFVCKPSAPFCPSTQSPIESSNDLGIPFFVPLFIIIFDFLVQFANVLLIILKKYLKNSSFFAMLSVMSISILIRCMCYFISAYLTVTESKLSPLWLEISMYLEFISGYFSKLIMFFMSLNRCLCFVSKNWNEMIFEGNHYLFPIFITIILSISASILSIKTAEIYRIYDKSAGFVNISSSEFGWENVIARLFYAFPILATISYLILFLHLKKQSKLVFSKNSQKGEQKVFTQLLITVVFSGIILFCFEILNIFAEKLEFYFRISLIILLNVANFIPEILLPLIFLISNSEICTRRKVEDQKNIAPRSSTTASVP